MVVFVEGDPRLREGFDYLFAPYLKGRKIFNLCKGKSDAVKKFRLDNRSHPKSLLVDLDNNNTERENDLRLNNLTEHKNNVHYMIQEMEAWFLSQPHILDGYFNLKISVALKQKYGDTHPDSIGNPKNKLKTFIQEAYKTKQNTPDEKKAKKNYDEVDDAIVLLKKLDLTELSKQFEDVKNLISVLN